LSIPAAITDTSAHAKWKYRKERARKDTQEIRTRDPQGCGTDRHSRSATAQALAQADSIVKERFMFE
jgi:hypothetical protein